MATRRLLLAAPALLPLAIRAQAQRTSRLVVPFPAGGATDGLARLWAPGFSQRIGLPVVVDNRPGAGGVPAADAVAKAAPDGLCCSPCRLPWCWCPLPTLSGCPCGALRRAKGIAPRLARR
jgi:tripartite-type tricarboxylate transporter receptor subunit TctC